MKVRVVFTLDVDAETWELEYGVRKDKLREDVNTYCRTQLEESPAPFTVLR